MLLDSSSASTASQTSKRTSPLRSVKLLKNGNIQKFFYVFFPVLSLYVVMHLLFSVWVSIISIYSELVDEKVQRVVISSKLTN
jgi:hypothetical protein